MYTRTNLPFKMNKEKYKTIPLERLTAVPSVSTPLHGKNAAGTNQAVTVKNRKYLWERIETGVPFVFRFPATKSLKNTNILVPIFPKRITYIFTPSTLMETGSGVEVVRDIEYPGHSKFPLSLLAERGAGGEVVYPACCPVDTIRTTVYNAGNYEN